MRLSPADEQLLRWYFEDFSGEQLRSSWATVVGRATGEIPPSARMQGDSSMSDRTLEKVRTANRVRLRLKQLPKPLRKALMAAYVNKREQQLEQLFDRLAGVVLLLPSVREAYRKQQDKKRAAGLSFVRWVIMVSKLDKAKRAKWGDEADELLAKAVEAWRATSRKRSIRAKRLPNSLG